MKKTNIEIIQTISKVLGIISKVVMILCFVGIVLCIVGTAALSTISVLGSDVVDSIEESSGRRMSMLIGGCINGVILCISQYLIAKFSLNYFLMEQQAGTPFTMEGAKSFRSLGIANIVIPFVAVLICAIVGAITGCRTFDIEIGMGTGIVMVLISFVFAYGAELSEKKSKEVEA